MNRAREDFEHFVADLCDPLLRTVYLIVRDSAAAEDVVQETLLRVARRWPRVRRMRHPSAYARRIAVNLALDEYRATRRELPPSFDAGSDENGRVELRADLIAALSELAPRARAVLVLRYYGDLSEAQVAETLGCSVGTVKSTASRALAALREQGANSHATR